MNNGERCDDPAAYNWMVEWARSEKVTVFWGCSPLGHDLEFAREAARRR